MRRMEGRKYIAQDYINEIDDTIKINLKVFATALASPIAKKILTKHSTMEDFIRQLDNPIRSKVTKALLHVPIPQQQALFEKRLSFLS